MRRALTAACLLVATLAVPARAETAPERPASTLPAPEQCGFADLGSLPLTGATTAGTAMDRGRIYSVTSSASGPALLGIRDAGDGRLIAEHPLPRALGSWAVTVAEDHTVYVGTYGGAEHKGRLFRYDPEDDKVTELGVPVDSETFVWTVAATEDYVYGGTSGNGHLVRYDPDTGETKDLGRPVPGQGFIRDLAVDDDGTVYAGMGSSGMQVAVLSPDGEVRRVLDAPIDATGWAYDVDVVGRYLLVRYETSAAKKPLAVYDLKRRTWLHVTEDVDSLTVGGAARGHVVHLVQKGELIRLDLRSGRTTKLGMTEFGEGGIRTLGWRGNTLVGTSSTGGIWHYDRRTGKGRLLDGTLTGQPVAIRSMTEGPDGRLYAGGFFTGGLAAYDPGTGATQFWPRVGQSEGMVTHQGKLYLGVYPGGRIYEFDGTAPKLLLNLTEQEQDRPFSLVSAGDWLAFGTVPKSGTEGGALGLVNPATGESRIRRNIIPGHSVVGVTYRDGVVYGATSVFGGTGRPLDTVAKVFAYDIAADRLLWQSAPVPGDLALGELAFDGSGKLWGLTPDALFEMDPATGETLRTAKHQTYPWENQTQVWHDTDLVFHAGLLWGKTQGKAYRIDPASMRMTLIARPVSNLEKGPDGNMYLSRNERFYTYRVC
ncbi:PQQ-binding-like beta-propeller repeat protein [Streptomyces sp. NPDC051018]|uniref:outer membrane protein assembly factor BamB family protein n=1 Tax=Streptomyces sp. NPDC051018 TaxID=3365639 RepID=UPI0037AFB300